MSERPVGTSAAESGDGAAAPLTYAALAALVFIWASNFSVVKFALRELSPLAFNGLRFTLASLILWIIVKAGGKGTTIERRHWPALIGLGIVGNTIYQILFIYGIDWTLAGNASLMLATTPLFTTLLSVIFRLERIAPLAWIGVLFSVAGIALVVWGGAQAVEFSAETVRGDLTTLAAAIAWSSYTVGSSPLVRRYGALPVTAVTMWIGGLALLIVSLPAFFRQDWSAVGIGSWLSLLYSGTFAIALAYFIWYYSIRHIGNTRTAVYSNAIPIVAILIAWATLGEVPTWLQWIGAAGIVGGSVLVRLGRIHRYPIRPPAE